MKTKILFIGFLFFIIVSCNVSPQPISYGNDGCNYCSMTIIERNYGAELVTSKGKVFKYDSMECLINSSLEENSDLDEYAYVLTNTNGEQETLKNAKECVFMINKKLPSPMGANLTAFENKALAENTQQSLGGELYTWDELLVMFKKTRN